MYKYVLFFVLFLVSTSVSANDTCNNLKSYKNLDCKDTEAVHSALNDLHSCMKARFTYKDIVHAAAWPTVDVPPSGPFVGGDAEWSIACLESWPCREKRLAFVEKEGSAPYLVMVSHDSVVDYNLDSVYEEKRFIRLMSTLDGASGRVEV
jgi:hypothetical protein